ncbi:MULTISPECIES: hypothetical protein [unclassified Aureimonas]|uniref:hypothetical protein n=1 Tax=unclassified Aureimonas TaxID=2615206 RepID=UPI00070B3A57|nr:MULTISPECIES: hypothetical protein [unclassified Aureimonas]KQT66202.1 hypothetical protein ASG62_19375 [Aureimonas sp. Leaf427]KQT72390.1 hypothetical protein ASG54_03745 [Aureimonas sp. Leaf460]
MLAHPAVDNIANIRADPKIEAVCMRKCHEPGRGLAVSVVEIAPAAESPESIGFDPSMRKRRRTVRAAPPSLDWKIAQIMTGRARPHRLKEAASGTPEIGP